MLPSEVTTGWTVAAEGASVTTVGASGTVSIVVSMEAGVESAVTASVVPTLADSTVLPPGAGVSELKGSPFVGLTLTVEVTPDSVAASAKHPHKTINM